MKLLLCRHRGGGSAEGDAPPMGGSTTAIGEKGEESTPPEERTSREATQSSPRHHPVEGGKVCFSHCEDTPPRAAPPVCSHQRETNKRSCLTEGDPLRSSADLPAGGGKGPLVPTRDHRQVGNPPDRVMNRVRSELGRRKKGENIFTRVDDALLRRLKRSACRFVKEVNRTCRCVRRSGAGGGGIGRDDQREEKPPPRKEDGVAKRRGILRGERSSRRGSPKKGGLRVQWADGKKEVEEGEEGKAAKEGEEGEEAKEGCFLEGGSSGLERGGGRHGNPDGAPDCAQLRTDDGEEKVKEASPQGRSARSGEETVEGLPNRFGGGAPPQQGNLEELPHESYSGERTYSEVDAYVDTFRETLGDDLADDLTDHMADRFTDHLSDDITDLQPIHLATKEGNLALVKKMLQAGTYINSKTKTRQFTPLHLSASRGDIDAVRFLIENDADVNALSCDNETPLWCASISNHLNVCKYFLSHGALPNLTLGRKRYYDSPLHAASMMGNYEIAKLLIENGADVSCLDSNQLEPVHYASFEGHKGIVKLLIWQQIRKAVEIKMKEILRAMHKYGVYSKTLEQFYYLKCKSFYKKRITSKTLCCAITSGKDKTVNLILRRGADPNYFDVRLQLFPIHAASITGNLKIFKNLVKRGANIYAKTGCNNAPIDLTESVEIKQFILEHSRRINLRNAWLVRRRKAAHVLARLSPDAFYHVCGFL
ncbi:ankyrin-repeat protein, putative [Plasmodium vivax]|nr:ankyrin-repeat protein, putative [Plasmodium vivax]